MLKEHKVLREPRVLQELKEMLVPLVLKELLV